LKLQVKAFWIATKLFCLALLLACPHFALAQEATAIVATSSRAGPVLEFKSYEAVLGKDGNMPTIGWESTVPAIRLFRLTPEDEQEGRVFLWGKMRFDAEQFGSTPLAIYSVGNRDQFKMFLNGRELYRNYVKPSDNVQSWYRPFLIPIPPDVLRPGSNEIVFQNSGWRDLAIGWTFVGPQEVLKDRYEAQMLFRIYGPIVANMMMIFLGLCAICLWFVRRDEPELLFLGLAAIFWLIRNYHYYNLIAPINPLAFAAATHFSLYFAAASSTSFGLAFLKRPHYKAIIAGLFAFGFFICGLHFIVPLHPVAIFIPAILISIFTSTTGFLTLRKSPSREHFMVSAIMCTFVFQALHDLLRHQDIWDGLGFYLQPYVGFMYTTVFLLTFGTRAQTAFVELNATNETLEKRVTQARVELAQSEASRRDLKVNEAVASERVRLMQEMHDGIGSNLITALAVAKHQNHPPEVVRTLSRALSDLKITVDSLEPVGGDVVLLIANLRHRMANNLAEAGLACSWEVTDCPLLPWLDATSALHLVRIFQEAISNVIEHAEASQIRIGCIAQSHADVAGVKIFVIDNGKGFDATAQTMGKGIANMEARAQVVNASFTCQSQRGIGTTVSVWLPVSPTRKGISSHKVSR
jgi:signal transduction histidine kinase